MHKSQNLRKLIEKYAPFPDTFSQLNPIYKNDCFIIPFYGESDSKNMLAMKTIFYKGLEKQATTQELFERYIRLKIEERNSIAYGLSHELIIATIASFIALQNQDKTVYEVGAGFGHGSLHYSRMMEENNITSDKPIYKLTAIEISKECYDIAKEILKRVVKSNFITEVKYVNQNGKDYLSKNCKDGDIIFSALATPEIVKGITELAKNMKVKLIVSYSEKTSKKIKKDHNWYPHDLIDDEKYDIFPFEDKEYKIHCLDDQRRFGFIAQPI